VRGFLLGTGTATDAHHVTAPHPEGAGALAALHAALADAALPPDAVDYVNAHGSGTPKNDAVEVRVLRAVFGRRLPRVPVSSTKSQLGHCLGAAGAIEAAATVLALGEGILPPTLGLHDPEPEWDDLDLVPAAGRRMPLGVGVTSSYGFGGHNVTLVFGRPERA
jgi:3-oxoacyl-[acyl-carrier-protein] synthase II